ncbi:variable surface protein [Plasmodium gonderi]|uniref:Variable surface protein n=1 Tax=Plasmodium gonderi TaxID=77519 RepID=A0A1Y1JUR5_PLAGO|nr:variable surface protein [Plasmodium gonderi]GAW84153.1 variable surface protein [Plasmodium gonderi]
MAKNIYKLAKDFPTLESIMNNARTSVHRVKTGNCSSLEREKFQTSASSVNEICEQVENYGDAIKLQESEYTFTKSSCIYLYYWLYYYNNNYKKYVSEVKSLYTVLIRDLDLTNCTTGVKSDYSTISDDEMLKLKDLHDMYTNIKNIMNNSSSPCKDKCNCANKCANLYMKYKVSCESDNYSDFCNELKNVRHKYNALSTTECTEELKYKMLPLFQKNNISVPIVITTLVILLIAITLFILHNFTQYNLCSQGTLRRKRNKWNHIDEDYNIFQSYKNGRKDTIKSRHHILYYKD